MATMHTKGLKIYIEKAASVRAALVPTAISSAAPAVVTVANTLVNGDIIFCVNTGFSELDGKYFVVGAATVSDFSLIGSDTSATTDTLDASPEIEAIEIADDMQLICANSISVDANVPGNISVPTFCDLNASIPSQVTEPGNVTLTLYHDPALGGFQELKTAQQDGNTRVMSVVFPNDAGTLLGACIVSGFTVSDVPLDGAATWTATLALLSPLQFAY